MTDVLILGGGLAGSASAYLLAKAGKGVRLIERENGAHHKVCGEFLSIEAHRHLVDLGVDVGRMGAAPIDLIQIASGRHIAEAQLPFAAFGFSRYQLDEALIERASDAGAVIERGVKIQSVESDHVRTSSGERVGNNLLLATGKHGVRRLTPACSKDDNPYVGFKMHYRLTRPARSRIDRAIRLILFDGGYAGLQPIEDGLANLCLVIRRDKLVNVGGNWASVHSMLASLDHCRDMLTDAEPMFTKPVTIANLAYGRTPDRHAPDPIFRLGDQAGMTASLTGDGMAVALRSAFIAAQCVKEGKDATDYRAWHRREMMRQMRCAMALQHMQEIPVVRLLGMYALGVWPALLKYAARATRLPQWQIPSSV
ncbi:MAG: FAD-dependent monooxygenase [Sphingobium sp.]